MNRKLVIYVLITIITVLLGSNTLLAAFDPWGVVKLVDNGEALTSNFQLDERRGYVMLPGVYHTERWMATVLTGNTRSVPHTNAGAPFRLVILGDSVTFGWGVSDDEAWVDLVARELPDVHIVNAAIPGYNIQEVEQNYRAFAGANAYLYITVCNDPYPSGYPARFGRPASYLEAYMELLGLRGTCGVDGFDRTAYFRRIEALANEPCMTVVSFDNPFGRLSQQYVSAIQLIPMFHQTISPADGHASVEGNREIAAAMLPIVRTAVRERCTAIF